MSETKTPKKYKTILKWKLSENKRLIALVTLIIVMMIIIVIVHYEYQISLGQQI